MSMNKEQDFGTPARVAAQSVTLEIDGFKVTAPMGTSVMRAAASIGIDIPKLCATDSVEPFGSCRRCVLQIEGGRGMPASCTTPVAEGMKVVTQNQRLADVRRGVMELLRREQLWQWQSDLSGRASILRNAALPMSMALACGNLSAPRDALSSLAPPRAARFLENHLLL